jgi:ElaB/YqjD/DUF883 family membrane-anchored ribosome-binding protein
MGVSPSLIKGFIAAESGGIARAGEARKAGYKGLMQAGDGLDQLIPEISIRTGAKKLRDFTNSVKQTLRRNGIDPGSLESEELIRLVSIAYNAGPGSYMKSLEYAIASGEPDKWFEPRHFQRALLYHGAYSIDVALIRNEKSPLMHMRAEELAAELQRLTGKSEAEIISRYHTPRGWKEESLREAIASRLNQARKKLKGTGLTIEEASRQISPLLVYATEFKHNNLRTWYPDKTVRYYRYFLNS